MKQNTILPIDNATFLREVNILFNLDDKKINTLFELLNKKKDVFSTKSIVDALKMDTEKAVVLRRLMIYLLHNMKGHTSLSRIKKELLSIKIKKTKINLFFKNVGDMNNKTIASIGDLFDAMSYTAVNNTLGLYGVEINHTFLESDLQKMIPFVLFKINSNDGTRKFELQMDANMFETLVYDMNLYLQLVKQETKNLKETMGDRYIRIIGD